MAYTSGTTGRPTGVKRLPVPPDDQARQTAAMQQVVAAAWGVKAGVRAMVSAPLYHSAPASAGPGLGVRQARQRGAAGGRRGAARR